MSASLSCVRAPLKQTHIRGIVCKHMSCKLSSKLDVGAPKMVAEQFYFLLGRAQIAYVHARVQTCSPLQLSAQDVDSHVLLVQMP